MDTFFAAFEIMTLLNGRCRVYLTATISEEPKIFIRFYKPVYSHTMKTEADLNEVTKGINGDTANLAAWRFYSLFARFFRK